MAQARSKPFSLSASSSVAAGSVAGSVAQAVSQSLSSPSRKRTTRDDKLAALLQSPGAYGLTAEDWIFTPKRANFPGDDESDDGDGVPRKCGSRSGKKNGVGPKANGNILDESREALAHEIER